MSEQSLVLNISFVSEEQSRVALLLIHDGEVWLFFITSHYLKCSDSKRKLPKMATREKISTSTIQQEGKPMRDGIEYLLELNKQNSAAFVDPGNALNRRQYRGQHPTEVGFLKCMDGRLHGPVMTETEPGIIQPWRNLGGRFDLGWIAFQQSIKGWVDYSISKGRDCLIGATYHYARGDRHRGCRGFNYNTEAAQAFSLGLKQQFDRVFGRKVVYPVQIGIETDLEALILHGEESGDTIDLATIHDSSPENLRGLLRDLYPDMPETIRNDFLPIIQGNIAHIGKIRASRRPVADADHKEWVLGVGRGFDWLHEINTALIVGPFDPNLSQPITTAAKLLKSNLDEGRINGEGIVLLASAPYRESAGPERLLAEEKARFLNRLTLDIIQEHVPDLLPKLQQLTVTVDLNTRQIDVLQADDIGELKAA